MVPQSSGIVREAGAANAAGLFFLSHTDEERTQSRRLRGVEHRHGTGARGDHSAVGEADPLAAVLFEKLVADGPVLGLVCGSRGEFAGRSREEAGRQCSSSVTSRVLLVSHEEWNPRFPGVSPLQRASRPIAVITSSSDCGDWMNSVSCRLMKRSIFRAVCFRGSLVGQGHVRTDMDRDFVVGDNVVHANQRPMRPIFMEKKRCPERAWVF